MIAFFWFAAWRLVRLIPESLAYKIFNYGAAYVYRKNGRGVQRLRKNLSQITKADETLIKRAVESYLRYWCEAFRLPNWSKNRITETVKIINGELLMDALKAIQPVVVALPHSGNWDHAGAYYSVLGYPVTTVAERLKPDSVFRAFLKYRQSIGLNVLALEPRVISELNRTLKNNGFVALVADRDLSESGVAVRFFDRTAKFPPGPALLASKNEALLLSAIVYYSKSGIEIEFEKIETEGSVEEITQRIADSFARGISKHPEDWHMLQKIWVDDDF